MTLSVCTTNYNCAHALAQHLRSVYENLKGLDFEYLVVDNFSKDESLSILQSWASSHTNMTVVQKRCTMGEGRQVAFKRSQGNYVMVVDTDVVYASQLRRFVDRYFETWSEYSVQAVYCAILPRHHWESVGGRRSLNTNEDADMWVRLWNLGLIRWSLVVLGTNLKEPGATGSYDYLSSRYSRLERVLRLFRRQLDMWKTHELQRIDIDRMIEGHTVDLGLSPTIQRWPQNRVHQRPINHFVEFVRQMKQAIHSP
jgi:glycosyltransferase involved in cell wall biosynthesis